MEAKKKNILLSYFRWSLYFGILLVVMTGLAWGFDNMAGKLMTLATLIYLLTAVLFYLFRQNRLREQLSEFGADFAQVQNQLFRKTSIPFAMMTAEGTIFWSNPAFQQEFDVPKKQIRLSAIFPPLETATAQDKAEHHVEYNGRKYALRINLITREATEALVPLYENDNSKLYSVYLIDETELEASRQELSEERNVMALIYLDNYEEVMSSVEEVRKSLLSALLERKLNKYVSSVNGVIRKLEKDRFLVILKQKDLWKLQESSFAILEDIKTVNIGNDIPVTISMGIGAGGASTAENYNSAGTAIDMALGRGGDQVVLKEGSEIHYYGGKSHSTERNTRVKARIKAQALRELIESKDQVIVMGHPLSDLDCLGAAMGIYRAAKFSQKKTYIVLNTISHSLKPLVDIFDAEEYEPGLFINADRAKELLNKDTLLVVVDTNRPSYTECPELIDHCEDIVVMDHHRQGKERIEKAILSYVEPFASSASEMVAEIMQYYDESLRLRPAEADAVLSGIVMDTNSFENKSGVRTFEAAAYLRRCGADVTRVRKLLRDNLDDYMLRAETIRCAEVFMDDYMISVCPSETPSVNQTIVAAQAANELLEIEGVKASFVLTEYQNKIFISARSIDEANVQVMMEKLGGGGHLSVAGAQFTGITIDEAMEKLKDVIREQENA